MKRRRAVVSVVAALLLTGAAPAGAVPRSTEALPDLAVFPPHDLEIRVVPGARLLLLSNTIENIGAGPFELRPENDPTTNTTRAFQQIFAYDSAGDPYIVRERAAGTFAFHPAHGHWHFGDFARYELRDVGPLGTIGHHVFASSTKVSFCVIDTDHPHPELPHSPLRPVHTFCPEDVPQGISVGWADTYSSNLPGQSIDITGLRSGLYWLVSTADPDNRVLESNDANNVGAALVFLYGRRLKVIASTPRL